MLRKWSLVAAIIAVVLLGFSYDSLLNAGIRFYLNKKTQELEIPLAYSKVESSPHFLIFHEPIALLEGGQIHADKLIIEHHFKPFSRHIDVKVHLENPCFNVEQSMVDLESIVQNLNGNSSFFTSSGELNCINGSLSLCSEYKEKIFFDFVHNWTTKEQDKCIQTGSYFFNLSEGDKTSTVQIFFTAEDPSNIELHANLQKVSAEKLAETLKAFVPDLASWNFKKGVLDGEFAFAIANAKFIQGKGELTINDLHAEEKNLGLSAKITKAIFRTDAKTGNASLDILDNGLLTFADGSTYASFKDFNGKVEITDADHLEMTFNGIWEDEKKPLHTEIKGSLHLDDFTDLFLKISLNSIGMAEEPSFISIDAKRLGSNNAIAQIDLQKFGPKQFHFWQRAIEKSFPGLNPISYHSGTLNALLKVTINKDIIESLKVENIEAEQVFFIIKHWEAAFGADKLLGKLAINFLNPNPQNTVNADIDIANGQASLIGLTYDFWHFNHIETHLSVRDGIIQKSFASVELAGLKGSAVVNSFSEQEILRFELKGNAMNLKPFLPESMQPGIDRKMSQDHLVVKASVSKTIPGVKVLGALEIQNAEGASPPISFGFEIERSPEEFLNPNFYENAKDTIVALNELSLPYLHALFHLEERLLLREAGIQGFVLRDGWFKAENILLDKFVSPFLFSENNFSLKGMSNIAGSFDHLGLTIRYDARSLVLENEALTIDVEKVTSNKIKLPAVHHFDFTSGKHFGELPLQNGSYFDKNSGLFFSDVHAHVIFEGKKIHILDVDAFSNGLYFGGHIDIDYNKPEKGVFDLEILISSLHGKFSQIQHFFSHFNKPFFFLTLPLDGDVTLRNNGCRLNFNFQPDDFTLTTIVDGNISDAILRPEDSDLSIQALSMNFSYNSKLGLLDFFDLQGTLLTGKPSSIDEYTIHSNRIYFSNYENNESEFDIWVKDQNRDLIRLAGNTTTSLNENNEKEIVFSFDPSLTHFGEIHPKKIALALTDWTKIAKAKLDFSFRLSTLLYDLQRFGKSGLLFSSPHFLKELSNLKNAGGECEVSFNYDSASAAFNFLLQGSDVTFDKYHFKNVSLSGKNQDKIWTIDQLQLDQLALAAEFTKIDSLWKANFLGLRYGKSLLVGLEGEYQEGDENVKARINLLEVNMAKLKEWPELAGLVKQYAPQGIMRGHGELNLEFFKNTPFRFDIDLEASLTNAKLKDLEFRNCDHFNCHFSSDKGMSFSNITTAVAIDQEPLQFHFDSILIDNQDHNHTVSGLKFDIPALQLPAFVNALRTNFPDLFSEDLALMMSKVKKSGTLAGELSINLKPSSTELQITLVDGNYYFADKEHFLSSFCLHAKPESITFSTQYQFNKHPFFMQGSIDAVHLNRGELILTDAMHQKDASLPPLVIHWQNDPQKGFVIENANGFFAGLNIQLVENQTSPSTSLALQLTGSVTTIDNQFRNLLEEETSEQLLKWQISQGYTLHGAFTIAKEQLRDERPVCFYGTLSGQNFHLKGYQFKQLQSQVIFGPQVIQLSDISITDPAGALYINQITITKEGEKSRLTIPLLNIQELRPSFLAEVGKPYPTQKKPLVIRDLNVHDIKGFLGKENSFTGKGSLYFNNPVKKHLQNTIFAFPAEILTRIGLDLSVLTPVTGTVNYEIRDGKVYLTKFKDIYSHSRLSRFYLPNSRTPSYMDFDGNLNIQVKMKQHTLIFKLAELFTVTIQGNLQKPTYTLLRQKPLHRSEIIASSDSADME